MQDLALELGVEKTCFLYFPVGTHKTTTESGLKEVTGTSN